ncbi:MAG: hypothetical protein ACYTEG_14215 [Planctomycetota bacterium]|jgi:hypothetical protein
MKRALRVTAYVLFILAITELAVRSYWGLVGGSFLDAPNRMHLLWYGRMKGVESTRDDGVFDVLLLGGSTMANLGKPIREALEQAVDGPVRVHNVADSAHTSLDSRSKYAHLAGERFELVVYYHAINEARANSCPPEMFRDDYTHYAWYRPIQSYDADSNRIFALPFTLRFVAEKLAPQMGLVDVVPKNRPREEWLDYGADIKTGPAFRRNLEWIADTAAERGDPFLGIVFATYVPPGYTDEKFRAGELGLVDGGLPNALWGRTENLVKAVRVHNQAVLDLRTRKDANVVDMRPEIPAEGRYWRDICHMSKEGQALWVAAFVRELTALGLLPH